MRFLHTQPFKAMCIIAWLILPAIIMLACAQRPTSKDLWIAIKAEQDAQK